MWAKVSMFRTTPRILMGPGAASRIGEEISRLGAKRVLVVTDQGILKAGLLERVVKPLKSFGIKILVFDGVEPDPRYELVEKCLEAAQGQRPHCVLGLGGGSALDIAKAASVMATNKGTICDYFGIELVPRPGLPLVLVPTTAGTGSEVTPIAILSDEQEKLKKGVVSSYLIPSLAILDPELTMGLPPSVTAATGMDALIHAIEAFTSLNATSMSDLLACRAMELLYHNIRTAFAQGTNLEARSKMLEGSLLAGMAFANAGVTAVHAFAYPIGAEFHIPHGIANSIMLTPVMEFNMLGAMERFAHMACIFQEKSAGLSTRALAHKAVEAMEQLRRDLRLPGNLGDFGVGTEDIPRLAAGVMKVTRLLANNPRSMTQRDAEEIYRKVL
ncbi:MAG: iron-containing alcohol dehydrogenase [bacterium]